MPKLKTMLTVMVELHEELPDNNIGKFDNNIGKFDNEERYFADINRALLTVPAVQCTSMEKAQVYFQSRDEDGIELRACPFCGRFGPVHTEECTMDPCPDAECELCEERCYRVLCDIDREGCGASSGWYETKQDAADGWNDRAERGV